MMAVYMCMHAYLLLFSVHIENMCFLFQTLSLSFFICFYSMHKAGRVYGVCVSACVLLISLSMIFYVIDKKQCVQNIRFFFFFWILMDPLSKVNTACGQYTGCLNSNTLSGIFKKIYKFFFLLELIKLYFKEFFPKIFLSIFYFTISIPPLKT